MKDEECLLATRTEEEEKACQINSKGCLLKKLTFVSRSLGGIYKRQLRLSNSCCW